VIADRLQFETAVTNLATNARDAMPGGGRLTIGTGNRHLDADYAAGHPELSPGDYVMIEVTDNGTGMSPELMAQVFQPFFTTKEPGKGSGLGLSMVFGYAKQSRGHVNAYSEPGAGTTFRLYLPRSFEQCLTRDQLVTPGEFPIGRGETILVVEDNAALRRIAVRQIRSLGYRVVEAAGAAEALAMLGREGVDLLFTDVVMPGGMDGFALAQATRIRWPAMRILLTSGFPASELLEAYEVSGYRVLNKPYIKDDLAQLLRAALN
jgi:CheY-like chemotaxis protein